MTRIGQRAARGAAWALAVAALLTLTIGALHTRYARAIWRLPFVAALAERAGCPIGRIDPATFERLRTQKLRGDAGSEAPRSRPALGFELGRARRADVERWAGMVSSACRTGIVSSVLECDDVRLVPPIAHLRLEFDGEARLVSVDLFRSAWAGELLDSFVATANDLDQRVGAATSSVGQPTLEFATEHPLALVIRSYGYRDYVAKLSLVNLGKRGLRLREQYGFLPPPA